MLFFGDSYVAGVDHPEGRGWVGRVVAESFAYGHAFTGYNLGVRGDTSQMVAARLRVEAEPRLVPGADLRVVLSFGVNDTGADEGGSRKVSEDRSRAAPETILAELSAIGLRTLMVGPPPVADPARNERIRSLSAAFAEVCGGTGADFIDVVDPLMSSSVWIDEVRAGDGAHPAGGGYEALGRLVLDGGWLSWLTGA